MRLIFPLLFLTWYKILIESLCIKVVNSVNYWFATENHLHLVLFFFFFAEISENYTPFYYQNLEKNIEDDLKKIEVSNFFSIIS